MKTSGKYNLMVIGGSAGSLTMVLKIIPQLTKEMNLAVVIVFHRKQTEDKVLLDVLSSRTSYQVKEVDDKDEIKPGVIYIAPADYHVLIENNKTLTLDDSEKINYSRPSIDVTFESASEAYGDKLACMLLSGANADGAEGLVKAKNAGALIIVQDPASAEVSYMPEQAIARVKCDFIVSEKNVERLKVFFG
jgi:two-component system chemotaxis response regulator CheB